MNFTFFPWSASGAFHLFATNPPSPGAGTGAEPIIPITPPGHGHPSGPMLPGGTQCAQMGSLLICRAPDGTLIVWDFNTGEVTTMPPNTPGAAPFPEKPGAIQIPPRGGRPGRPGPPWEQLPRPGIRPPTLPQPIEPIRPPTVIAPERPKPPSGILPGIGQELIGAVAIGGVIDGANESLNQAAHACLNMLEDVLGTGTSASLGSQLAALQDAYEGLQAQLVAILKNCVGRKSVIQRPEPVPEECLNSLREAIRRLQGAIDRVRDLIRQLVNLKPSVINIAQSGQCQAIADGDWALVPSVSGVQNQVANIKEGYNDALNTYKEWLAAVAALRRKCACVELPPEPRAGWSYGVLLPSVGRVLSIN